MKKKLILGYLMISIAAVIFGKMIIDYNGLMWILKVILFWTLVGYGYNFISRFPQNKITDYDTLISKSKMNIQNNVTICLHDDEYITTEHLDEDKNIIAFINFHPNNIKRADFYYSLFANKQVVTIDYNRQIYEAIITQIKLIDENTLRIYYTVKNN